MIIVGFVRKYHTRGGKLRNLSSLHIVNELIFIVGLRANLHYVQFARKMH